MLTEKKVEAGIVGREKPKHKGRPGSQSLDGLFGKVEDTFPKGRRAIKG